MRQVRLSPKAQADLDSIWEFTVQRWDIGQADDYMRALGETMKLLTASPHLGRSIEDIREDYFKFPTASHIIFYRVTPGTIEVIRILHKSMDVERHI